MPTRLLITGGCGFIGSHLIRYILHHHPDILITNLDCLTYAANPRRLADITANPRFRDRYTFVQGDIRDLSTVQSLLAQSDGLIHLAAHTHVDRSIADAQPFIQTNILGTQTLIDALCHLQKNAALPSHFRAIHVSTDEVYGSLALDHSPGFSEESPLHPSSPYAASKAAADLLVLASHHTHQLPWLITRSSNNFGPAQYPEKIIPLFIQRLLRNQHVPLYGDGLNVRDWLYVEDQCEALFRVWQQGRLGEIYNIAADNPHSNLELTHLLLQILKKPIHLIQPVSDRPGHDRRYALSIRKIHRELHWQASRSAWPSALEQTVAWYVAHPDGP